MAKVTPYLRTYWGVKYSDWTEPVAMSSAIAAREAVESWNNREIPFYNRGVLVTAKVQQYQKSDWGDDE
jgi:hypothetical protein